MVWWLPIQSYWMLWITFFMSILVSKISGHCLYLISFFYLSENLASWSVEVPLKKLPAIKKIDKLLLSIFDRNIFSYNKQNNNNQRCSGHYLKIEETLPFTFSACFSIPRELTRRLYKALRKGKIFSFKTQAGAIGIVPHTRSNSLVRPIYTSTSAFVFPVITLHSPAFTFLFPDTARNSVAHKCILVVKWTWIVVKYILADTILPVAINSRICIVVASTRWFIFSMVAGIGSIYLYILPISLTLFIPRTCIIIPNAIRIKA